MKFGEVCIHGSLKRNCEACDLADQLAAAKAEIYGLKTNGKIWNEHINVIESENKRLLALNSHVATENMRLREAIKELKDKYER